MIRDTTGRQALASVNRRIEAERRRRRWRRTLARLTRRANATGELREMEQARAALLGRGRSDQDQQGATG